VENRSGLSRTAAARRRHGHDDDALISPTRSIPSHTSVRDRIDRAKGMTARQAIRLKCYTTRSLKRGETAGYSRLVRAKGEVIRLPSCATQREPDELRHLCGKSGRRLFRLRQIASRGKLTARIPRLEAPREIKNIRVNIQTRTYASLLHAPQIRMATGPSSIA
jgi:hypothetical protein